MVNAQLQDPLADLKAEIAAEEAVASGGKPPVEEPPEEEAPEPEPAEDEEGKGEPVEAKEEPAAKEEEAKPKPKRKAKEPEERMVPAERLNEYAVRTRKLEKANEELAAELEKLKNPQKAEPPQPVPKTEDQIRAEARAQARLELQLEEFVTTGSAEYTREAFDAACNKISELIGGPSNLVAIAIEAAGSPAAAAKAIFRLGEKDAPEIEAFLKLSPIRQAAQLSQLAMQRARKEEDASPGKPKPRKTRIEESEEAPEPIRPLNASNRIQEGLGDDVPEDVWFERFEKQVMNKGRAN